MATKKIEDGRREKKRYEKNEREEKEGVYFCFFYIKALHMWYFYLFLN